MAAKLQHPNIVPIFEVGEHEGQPYYSMEFVQGQDLSSLLRSRSMLPDASTTKIVYPVSRPTTPPSTEADVPTARKTDATVPPMMPVPPDVGMPEYLRQSSGLDLEPELDQWRGTEPEADRLRNLAVELDEWRKMVHRAKTDKTSSLIRSERTLAFSLVSKRGQ